MKTRIYPVAVVFTCFFLLLAAWPGRAQTGDAPKLALPNIYDESADGAKQIAEALATAKKEQKHVLLQLGANWCDWCHMLYTLFQTNEAIAEELKSNYVLVLIDVNQGHNKDTDVMYGNPTRLGLPVLVVLDAEGKSLITQETGSLEKDGRHDPEKVMAFLKAWTPKR